MPLSIGIARQLTNEFTEDSEADNALTPSASKTKMPIKGTEGMLVSYGKCCRPIPGDCYFSLFKPR